MSLNGQPTSNQDGWTVGTVEVYLSQRMEDLEKLLKERYETQSKAIDAAKVAQETAMQTALTAAERAVSTARISDKEAVDKAELAADKRFGDFRTEVNGAEGRTAQRINDLTSRLDQSAGQGSGARTSRSELYTIGAIMISFLGIILYWLADK